MDDKKSLLKSIGWSEQLISKCLEGNDYEIIPNLSIDLIQDQISFLKSDLSTIIIDSDTTNISDGAGW